MALRQNSQHLEMQSQVSSAQKQGFCCDKATGIDDIVVKLEMASLSSEDKGGSVNNNITPEPCSQLAAPLLQHESPKCSMSASSITSSDCVDTITMEKFVAPILADHEQSLMTTTLDFWQSITTNQRMFTQCGRHRNDSGSDQSTSGTSQTNGTSKRENNATRGSKRRSLDQDQEEGDGHDDDDEDQEQPPKKQKGCSNAVVDDLRRFACPYYKRRPLEHVKYGACSGPGFPSVHRLKYDS
jgi:hypothetical protein